MTRPDHGNFLTDHEREAVIESCKAQLEDWMFGDGMEEQYIMEGFPVFKGLQNMTDMELLIELGHFEPGASDEEIIMAFRKEMAGEDV